MHIAIQGIPGCYHHLAAQSYFDKAVSVIPCMSFQKLVEVVANDPNCDGGIMAIENTIAGTILNNYHLLLQSGLFVCGEIAVRIQHHFLALEGQQIEDIKEVHSHPMAIKQCMDYLSKLNNVRIVEAADTAASAKLIATKQLKHTAAIASKTCASLYKLQSLDSNIETIKNNFTRFLILKKQQSPPLPNHNKALIYFNVNDTPGSLLKTLAILEKEGINLSKLQSFPVIGKPWEYYFFADLVFPPATDKKDIFEAMKKSTNSFSLLGSYEKSI